MIQLQKTETVEVFQIELCKKTLVKESPFIAILMLANELLQAEELIFAEDVQEKLFPVLPKKACENLLERLVGLEYFTEEWDGDPDDEDATFLGYQLTEFGIDSAKAESYWVGEKGLYNIYVSSSKLIDQKIIWIEEAREKVNEGNLSSVTSLVKSYEKKLLNINGNEVLLTDMEKNCYRIESVKVKIEIKGEQFRSQLFLKKGDQLIGTFSSIAGKEFTEAEIQSAILESTTEHHYDKENNAIKVYFDKSDISFIRAINIRYPQFMGVEFDNIKISDMKVIPIDYENAVKWYYELLIRNINNYFISENEYEVYSEKQAEYLKQYFDIAIISKQTLLKDNRISTHFYKKAKLETIDYLLY